MKIKNLLLATLLATAGAAFVNTASATATDVYISGATTFRAPVTAAILDQGTNGILVSGSTTCAYVGSSVYKANEAIFHGYLKGSGEGTAEVYIHTYWTGSAAGVYDVALPNSISGYIEDPMTSGTVAASGTIPGSGVSLGSVAGTNPAAVTGGVVTSYLAGAHYPDGVMSDSLSSSVANEFSTEGDPTLSPTVTGASLVSCGNSTRNTGSLASSKSTVGVAPMLWVLGKSTVAANFTNITGQAVRSLFGGPTSAELLSGTSTDKTNWVVLIGRNEDSGTRIGAMSDSQFGLNNPIAPPVQQFLPTFSGSPVNQSASPSYPTTGNPAIPEGGASSTVSSIGEWPSDWCLNTDNNIDWASAGHSGFTGGGDVANCLAATNPVTTTSGTFFAASAVTGDINNNGDTNLSGKPTAFASGQNVWLVGYLGVADAIGSGSFTVVGGQTLSASSSVPGGTVLTYNGVQYNGIATVEHGSYTYWVQEHMYCNTANSDTSSQTNPQRQTVDDIADFLFTYYAATNSSGVTDDSGATLNVAGVPYNDMNFSRSSESAVPTTK